MAQQFEPFPANRVKASNARQEQINRNHDVSRGLPKNKLAAQPVNQSPAFPELSHQEQPGQHRENVVAPEYNTPVSEPEGISIILPSQFFYYDFKDLYVHPLRAFHMSKLVRARGEKSIGIMAEVLNSVLTNSDGTQNIAHKLTLPDFYAVLYFMRFSFFTKTEFRHTDYCSNPKHIEEVGKGKLSEDTLKINQVITSSMLSTKNLESAVVHDRFIPAKIQDIIDYTENPNIRDEEFQWLGQFACYLKGETFKEKMELAANMSPDEIQECKLYMESIDEYGIEEQIKLKCNGCGASMDTKVSIDAHSFLPS